MTNNKKININRHIIYEELIEKYRSEKNSKIKERLLIVSYLYEGKSIDEIVKLSKRCERTIWLWIKRWNDYGYDGLIPKSTGGPKPKITDEQWDELVEDITGKGMTIKDVVEYLKKKYNVVLSYSWVQNVLRNKKKVKYGKPYIENAKQPANNEDILKKNLFPMLLLLCNPIIAFLDETGIQLNPNKIRLLNTPKIKYTLGNIRSKTLFGCMALNGNSTTMLVDKGIKENMMTFLQKIRKINPYGPIVIILDNAKIHHAKMVVALAEMLDIYLVYLPPYSPKLNPIEYGNKDLKRILAKKLTFEEMIDACEDTSLELFNNRKMSYSDSWRRKFLNENTICNSVKS